MTDRIDGMSFRRLMTAAYRKLYEHREQVNALNVFPVPDGDTGNNMSLTMEAALDELAKTHSDDVGVLAHAIATGALMGSRGNSGVILSQLFRGIASGLEGRHTIDGGDLARALARASDTAYANLLKPVEGTILTVARVAADTAARFVRDYSDSTFGQVLDAACRGAEEALQSTPDLLPVLKNAGVVDAGGQGLVWLLRGMKEAGQRPIDRIHSQADRVAQGTTADHVVGLPQQRHVDFSLTHELGDINFPYDTELLLRGERIPIEKLRTGLENLGDSVLVVGSESLVKVHVHTNQPDRVLSLMLEHGMPYDILIKDMRIQYGELEHHEARESESAVSPAPGETVRREQLEGPAVVAVASGEGFSSLFLSLGAVSIIPGGQTMNPSTRDIVEAVEEADAEQVIVLPNNSNVILSCEQARSLTDIEVMVVPTRSMTEGVIALLALRPGEGPEENIRLMTDALTGAVTGQVTYAVRETAVNGVEVREGDIIGMCGKDIIATSGDREQCLFDTVTAALFEGSTLVSVFVGSDIDEDEVEPLWKRLEAAFPEHDVEVQYGGQPHYYYVFSVE